MLCLKDKQDSWNVAKLFTDILHICSFYFMTCLLLFYHQDPKGKGKGKRGFV